MADRKKSAAAPAPHSWDLEHWPLDVYPHTSGRARYMVRKHRVALLAEGALTRVGRDLVVIGAAYSKFLAKRAEHVANFSIAPNRSQATG